MTQWGANVVREAVRDSSTVVLGSTCDAMSCEKQFIMSRDVKSQDEMKMRCAIGCNVRLCVSVYVRAHVLGASAASALRNNVQPCVQPCVHDMLDSASAKKHAIVLASLRDPLDLAKRLCA